MFEEMNEAIQNDAVRILMKGHFSAEKQVETKSAVSSMKEGAARPQAIPTQAQQVPGAAASNETAQPIKRDSSKVGRNDLCPCGSGKKYKNCCGKNL